MSRLMVRRLMSPLASRLTRRLLRDEGSAILEFTVVAVAVMVPLVYLVVAVAAIQRTSSAAGDSARAAGRAMGSASSMQDGLDRAQAAVRVTLSDAHLPADAAQLRIVPADGACDGPQIDPSVAPGDVFAVCVIVAARVPGVPSFFGGGEQKAVGRYVVHIDDFREDR